MAKKKNNVQDPTSQEVILGKKVDVGKGVGEKVAKQAKSALELRKELRKKFLMET